MEKRESFGTRLGFLLVSAGCAIGLGNIWKFPAWSRYFLVFVLPPLITFVLIQGLFDPLNKIFGILLGSIILALYLQEGRYLYLKKKSEKENKEA